MISLQNNKGILIGAESRANIHDERENPVGYYDKTQKVFLIENKLGIATTGSDFINGKFVSSTIINYKNSNKRINFKDLIKDFLGYLRLELGNNFYNQIFIFCGFENSKIVRYKYKQNRLNKINNYNRYPLIGTNASFPLSYKKFFQKDLIKFSKEIIDDYKGGNYPDGIPAWKRIGGPVDFLWLSNKGKFRWILRKKAMYFKDIDELKKWVKKTKCIRKLVSQEKFNRVIKKL